MMSQLLLDIPGHADIILALLGVATTVSALASLGRTWIEQKFSTRRFDTALKNAEPKQRAEIIRAWLELERSIATKTEDENVAQAGSLFVSLLSRHRRRKD